VITDFRPSDLAAVYFIEGLAYQYWYISAKLRAAGKGVKVVADPQGGLEEFRTEDQNTLISNFDQRTETYGISFGFSSNVGTFVWHKDYDSSSGMLFAALNVEQHLLSKIMPDHNLSEDFTPNYLPAYVDIVEYYRAHKYLEKAFAKRHGFGLKELCHVAQIISVILISKVGFSLEGVEGREELLIYQKFQRGYMFHGGPLEDLKKLVLELIRTRPGSKEFEGSNAEEQLSLTFDFLTLSTDKQKNISLWSAGPRYVFVPFNDYYICDYSAWFGIFRSLFFGLRNYDPKSQKGVEFEYAFGALAKYEDFDVVMQSKKINKGDQAREVDVAIRVGDALYLFECRAAERPLDFSLGSPKTIGIRNEDLLVKLNQVKSLADFLDENKIGDNYDVSWAKKVTGIVVSPYTEWVWSLEDDLWLSKDPLIPRVMSATEAIRYLRGIVR
jgi:hypothetical protein